ncbi:zinc ribbon domain-containing protein [Streptomyces sp. NPDC005463]|uniref:zinc ribbon domain-containing protein n=1 Tax=Streptomyces sp. NPDC005463 TaxID=3154465 RepID=UPI0033B40475
MRRVATPQLDPFVFACRVCGFVDHADHNASHNIAHRVRVGLRGPVNGPRTHPHRVSPRRSRTHHGQ